MAETTYGSIKDLPDTPYEEAVRRTTEALASEGFGILTEIDVKATMKTKLDLDYPKYVILGACNPPLAHRALTAEPAIGLLLPCNAVVAEREEGGSRVMLVNPAEMFRIVENPDVAPIAAEVGAKLERVLEKI